MNVYCDVVGSRAAEFARTIDQRFGVAAKRASSPEEVATGSDVIVTVTPSRTAIVHDSWVEPGTHISAIGADAPGKEELDPALLKRAKIVVDDWEQAGHSGEINIPVERGLLTQANIHTDMGQVVAGLKEGRTSDSEITMFGSTGLAIQDVITAWHAYRVGVEKGPGSVIPPLYLRRQSGVIKITARSRCVLRHAKVVALIACRYPNQGAETGQVACGSGTV